MKTIYTPLVEKCIQSLRVGEEVSLCGVIYTARDLAHQQLVKLIRQKKQLPVCLRNQIIYYCGPAPGPKQRVIGSCGPTTSARMDDLSIDLLKRGLKGMIGKGKRSPELVRAVKRYKAVYFLTIAGAGALLSTKVEQAKAVAYKKWGPEAIYKLKVRNFPLIVGIDSCGRDIYNT